MRAPLRRTTVRATALVGVSLLVAAGMAGTACAQPAQAILDAAGVQGGLEPD